MYSTTRIVSVEHKQNGKNFKVLITVTSNQCNVVLINTQHFIWFPNVRYVDTKQATL